MDWLENRRLAPLIEKLRKNIVGIAFAFGCFIAIIGGVMWFFAEPSPHLSLCGAADKGDLKRVKWLLDHGINVDALDGYHDTALIFAAGRGHSEIARYLVSHGADVNAGRKFGRSALIQAICNHHVELAKWLMAHGADVNVKEENGDTVLHYAAHYGNAEIAKQLIDRGAAINAHGAGGRTPLYVTLAIRTSLLKDLSVARVLLENGADPNIGVTDDQAFGPTVKTPLQLAACQKFPEAVELLKKYGAK